MQMVHFAFAFYSLVAHLSAQNYQVQICNARERCRISKPNSVGESHVRMWCARLLAIVQMGTSYVTPTIRTGWECIPSEAHVWWQRCQPERECCFHFDAWEIVCGRVLLATGPLKCFDFWNSLFEMKKRFEIFRWRQNEKTFWKIWFHFRFLKITILTWFLNQKRLFWKSQNIFLFKWIINSDSK